MTQTIEVDRTTFLGGTDAAAVLGLSRWSSPMSVWSEKTGAIARKDRSKELPIRLGKRMEEVVAELFEEESGFKVRRANEYRVHPSKSFLQAQIDRVVVKTDDILECKTASGFKAKEWEDDDVPPEYIIQCLHQLMVTGKERAHIACLIGGNQDFVWKIIERDESMIEELERKETEFWTKFVIPKVMPAVSPLDAPILYGLFPMQTEGEAIELPLSVEESMVRYKEIGTETTGIISELLAEKNRIGNEIRALMKTAEIATVGKWKATWKTQSTGVRLDTERIKAEAPEVYDKYGTAGSTRVLRINEIKAKGGK